MEHEADRFGLEMRKTMKLRESFIVLQLGNLANLMTWPHLQFLAQQPPLSRRQSGFLQQLLSLKEGKPLKYAEYFRID
jgi:hypothetical protein